MKKLLLTAAAIIGLTASAALAQMGEHEGMGSQQSHQMMSQEMMQDMTGMMKQMNEMMQKMSHIIEDESHGPVD